MSHLIYLKVRRHIFQLDQATILVQLSEVSLRLVTQARLSEACAFTVVCSVHELFYAQ